MSDKVEAIKQIIYNRVNVIPAEGAEYLYGIDKAAELIDQLYSQPAEAKYGGFHLDKTGKPVPNSQPAPTLPQAANPYGAVDYLGRDVNTGLAIAFQEGADAQRSLDAGLLAEKDKKILQIEAEVQKLRDALQADVADLSKVVSAIRKEIACRDWILEGRGSYAWDDDRYRKETGWAFEAVMKIIDEVNEPATKRYHLVMQRTDALASKLTADHAAQMTVLIQVGNEMLDALEGSPVDVAWREDIKARWQSLKSKYQVKQK